MKGDGKALVIEDNPDTREWLIQCAQTAFPDIAIDNGSDVTTAKALLSSNQYDLALIDLGLPDGSGLEVIKALSSSSPQCHIIVATIYDDDRNLFSALRAGAKGYILKDQDQNRIVSYLQGIKQNRPAISAASSQRLIDRFNAEGAEVAHVQLTPRESDVTRLIAKGCSVEDAAQLLDLSPDTIKGYVKNIYAKLGVNNRSEVTLEAIKLGLIDSE